MLCDMTYGLRCAIHIVKDFQTMYFRPYLWLTLCAVPAFIILLLLGSWQVQRLFWKTEIITEYKERAMSPAQQLPQTPIIIENLRFQRLQLEGKFLHEKELFLTGRTYEGNAGFHVVSPFKTLDGRLLLVNRGWVSEAYREPEKRPFSVQDKVVSIEAIIRAPQRKGYFVPENEPDRGFWFTLKPDEMADFLQLEETITDFYADQIRTGDVITLPIAADLKIDVANTHLNYALTWYGIALSLLGVYIAYHVNAGRLKIGSRSGE